MWTDQIKLKEFLNMLLKLVSWCSHGSDDPNQHRKSIPLVYTSEYSNYFIQTQTLMYSGKGCLFGLELLMDCD